MLADVLEFVRQAHGIPALGAVMVHQGRVIEMAAVGERVDGGSEAVTSDDRWHIGSLTKAMTATVVARLAERGELSWNTTAAEALPDLVGVMRSEYTDVTFTELFSHTSGLRDEIADVPIWPTLDLEIGPGTTEERRQWAAQLLGLSPERRVRRASSRRLLSNSCTPPRPVCPMRRGGGWTSKVGRVGWR